MHLLKDTMTNGTSIDQNDRLLGRPEVLQNNVDDVILLFGIVCGLGEVDGCLEPTAFDLRLHHVCGQHQIHGTRLDEALTQSMVDLVSDLGRSV